MTIEQRAKGNYPSGSFINGVDYTTYARDCYMRGATEQQKIDDEEQADTLFIQRQMLIEKACKWLDANLVDSDTFDKEWFIGRFKDEIRTK